ncbi:MAG: sialidase family protein [Sphingobacteriaceae bacterium]
MTIKIFALFLCLFLFAAIGCFAQATWQKLSTELMFDRPPFQECHASTLAELSPGKFMAAWFGGTQEGHQDVCIWFSTLENGKWSTPSKIAEGSDNPNQRYPLWNPVLFKAKEGKLFLFYKEGKNPREWWGMVKTSTDDGKVWSAAERLPEGVLGPIKNKPVQLADGTILSPSSVETKRKWTVHMERSSDLGKTWQIIPVDHQSAFDVIQPSVLFYPENKLQILSRSKQGSVVQSWSGDEGKTWSKMSSTKLANPNSGIDAVTLEDGTQLIVYNPTLPGKDWSNGREKLNVAQSEDGITWKDIFVLEDGKKGDEFSYPAIIQASDRKIHLTYTHNRTNITYVVLEKK